MPVQDETVLGAITLTLLPPWPSLPGTARYLVEADVVSYVHEQVRRMPTYLRLPFRIAVLAFALGAQIRHVEAFPRLAAKQRQAWVETWALSRIGALRDFIRMIRSCALLAYFDHPTVSEALAREECNDLGARGLS